MEEKAATGARWRSGAASTGKDRNRGGEQGVREYDFDAMGLQADGRLRLISHRGFRPVQHFSALIGTSMTST